MDIAKKHQLKIARKTLAMTPEWARIMGGMTHKDAYQLIFGEPLADRLRELIAEYPNATKEHWVSTELDKYGWSTTEDWKRLLVSITQRSITNERS